jgi:hypothetical protein
MYGMKRLKMHRSIDLGLRHHFWWLFGRKEFQWWHVGLVEIMPVVRAVVGVDRASIDR